MPIRLPRTLSVRAAPASPDASDSYAMLRAAMLGDLDPFQRVLTS